MAICFVNQDGTTRLENAGYSNEGELEGVVAANPYLLLGDSGA